MRLILQYISGMIPYCLFGMVVCAIIRTKHYHKNISKNELWREILMLLFVAYCAGLASQRILPRIDAGIYSESGKPYFNIIWNADLASVNIIPFRTIWAQLTGSNSYVGQSDVYAVSALNLLSNILLFSPMGIFMPLLWHKFRSIKYVVETGIIISVCVEVIQLLVGRSCDIDDVILNTVGILIGFMVYKLIETLKLKH